MYIVVNAEAAEKLRENYTLLELETLDKGNGPVTAWCVIEQVPLSELATLDQQKLLHAEFIKEYNAGNYKFCIDVAEHLMGKFGGEVDSFYEEILKRIS